MTSSSAVKRAIGILSIGDMGMGVAKLLKAHDYMVYTVATGRSQHTLDRIKAAEIISLPSDEALVAETDIILSIVPPRDAVETARRISDACRSQAGIKQRSERRGIDASSPQAPAFTYIDLNAISPRTAITIEKILKGERRQSVPRRLSRSLSWRSETLQDPIPIHFLDGGIIGGPPSLKPDANGTSTWKKPSLVISGPNTTSLLPPDLIQTLGLRILSSNNIGTASALKCCFASLTKGLTALSILSFTTAQSCGVLNELESHLSEFSPATLNLARNGLTSMPPKAYRWIDEMREIASTFSEQGGFGVAALGTSSSSSNPATPTHSSVFEGIADIYRLVADDTVLGNEKVGKRKRGQTPQDVAECMGQGIRQKIQRRRSGSGQRNGSGNGNVNVNGYSRSGASTPVDGLEAAWRGNWS